MLVIFFLSLTALGLILAKAALVWAGTADFLEATVKISICGNGIVEGGEDCEGLDLNGEDCVSLGYGPGTLSCDISCSFDTYDCTPAPSPSPSPSPSPASSATPAASTTTSASPTPTALASPSPVVKTLLPSVLIPFDPNGDDRITLSELFTVTKNWVEEWKQAIIEEMSPENIAIAGNQRRRCDLNRDSRCNLLDFSILMSYVEK
ncbi:MAG: hypothetical protein V1810_02380 [Candidatus Beckwithbacteria bacterium]